MPQQIGTGDEEYVLPDDEEYVSVKMTLNQVLKREHSAKFRQIIKEQCLVATRFQYLASLLLLQQVNVAVENNDSDFLNQNGTRVISKQLFLWCKC